MEKTYTLSEKELRNLASFTLVKVMLMAVTGESPDIDKFTKEMGDFIDKK